MAILALGMTAPALQDAFAAKADNSEKLSPKSFGHKTMKMKCGDATCFVKTTKTPAKSLSQIEMELASDPRIQKYIEQHQYIHRIVAP